MLSSSPASVAEARHAVGAALRSIFPEDRLHDALVVVSELVTNAIVHGGTEIELRLCEQDGRVRLGVADGSPARPYEVRSRPTDTHGRGIALVGRLCERWWVEDERSGKCVWCDLGASRN